MYLEGSSVSSTSGLAGRADTGDVLDARSILAQICNSPVTCDRPATCVWLRRDIIHVADLRVTATAHCYVARNRRIGTATLAVITDIVGRTGDIQRSRSRYREHR